MGLQVDLLKSEYPHNTEFIDFSFDGKKITDFGLVAVVDGDRLQFDGSPSFTDETTAVNGVVGQYYWGTNIGTKTKTYTLATDGMTEQQVQAFQYHFRPGHYGKFIDDTFAFRYSYCRVSSVTNFRMIPFKKEIEYIVNEKKIKSFVNEYKGEVTISFTWDYPYSFSEANYIDNKDWLTGTNAIKYWRAVANNQLPIPGSWKVYIPPYVGILGIGQLAKMILGSKSPIHKCHLGSNRLITYQSFEDDTGHSTPTDESGFLKAGSPAAENKMIFYNPSTVETPCVIKIENIQLRFTPIAENTKPWEPVYFNNIVDNYNKYRVRAYVAKAKTDDKGKVQKEKDGRIALTPPQWMGLPDDPPKNPIKPYNTIAITDELKTPDNEKDYDQFMEDIQLERNTGALKQFFHYTTPSIINQIHQSINIAEKYSKGTSANCLELEEELRETLTNHEILAWAMGVLTFLKGISEFNQINENGQIVPGLFNNSGTIKINSWLLDNYSVENTKVADQPPSLMPTRDVNWFGYFNILMLFFFMGIPNTSGSGAGTPLETLALHLKKEDKIRHWYNAITKEGKLGEPRTISLTFNGIEGETLVNYRGNEIGVNSEEKDSIRAGQISEKKCGDAVLSNYLKLGGGNSLTQTGEIASCYSISFKLGGLDYTIPTTKLEYKYTYI